MSGRKKVWTPKKASKARSIDSYRGVRRNELFGRKAVGNTKGGRI